MSSEGGLRMYDYVDKDAYVISMCVFSGIAILANLFMMITILASQNVRTSPKHILIFALCLTDFYSGVFEYPLMAQFLSLEKWIHDPKILEVLDFSVYLLMISVRMALVIAICVNCILSRLTPNKRLLNMLSVSMIIGSFGYAILLVLPVSEDPDLRLGLQDSCYWSIMMTKQKALGAACFFPQALVMIVLTVDILVMSCRFKTSLEPRKFPVDVILASVLMLIYIMPFRIVHTYFSSCSGEDECRRMHISRGVTERWEVVRSCVMPFIWLLCQETRKAVCCCRREERPSPTTVYTHDINNYQMQNQPQKGNTRL